MKPDMTNITDILAMEPITINLPHGYSLARHDKHSPWKLLLNGEMLHHTSKYNKDGWFVFLGEEGDEKHIQAFAAAMNASTQEAILGKKLAECLGVALIELEARIKEQYNSLRNTHGRLTPDNQATYDLEMGIISSCCEPLTEWNKLEGVK